MKWAATKKKKKREATCALIGEMNSQKEHKGW
jgi:hypothetical protein